MWAIRRRYEQGVHLPSAKELEASGKDWVMDSIEGRTTWSVPDEHIYEVLAGSALSLVMIGTVAYRLLEDWSWVDSVYFSVIAFTTVGFGDITPSIDASKLFTVIYVLTGISVVPSYLHARMNRKGTSRLQQRAQP